MLYDQVASLDVRIDGYDYVHHSRNTSSGFTRKTTVIALSGDGRTGHGEDVTYESAAHDALDEHPIDLPLPGPTTLDGFASHLDGTDLFPGIDPGQPVFRNYRRWAFESAALDLALKQADTDLADYLELTYRPVRFVVSTRLHDPPTGDRVLDWLDRNPDLEFKLDPTSDWTEPVVKRLAETNAVRALDLKGQYHGTSVDQPADAELYDLVINGFPDVLLEDPALTDETRPMFEGHEERVTWDYPIRSVETITDLPWEPQWLNIKPSRFGSIQALFDAIDYCRDNGIRMFGGGQFELSVGREHLHALASLWYPDAPNDIAPKGYNDPEPATGLPTSPLEPPTTSRGLDWS